MQSRPPLCVVHIASEVYPFSHSGGLALVTGSLPAAQRQLGLQTAVISPLYATVPRDELTDTGCQFTIRLGRYTGSIRVFLTVKNDVPLYFLECEKAFGREGMYGPKPAVDYPDNGWRFALFARGAMEACRRLRIRPDIFHCHDWHAGLVPFWARTELNGWVRSIQTVHNLGYQGTFPAHTVDELGIETKYFQPSGLEFWGWLSYLKAGLIFADRITTVSPTYATEIQTARFGHGLDGVLRERTTDLCGILNGLDTEQWNPQRLEPSITPSALDGRYAANARLRERFRLESGGQIACVVSRLVSQKGIDLIAPAIRPMIESGTVRLIVVGDSGQSGVPELLSLREAYPHRVIIEQKYSFELARDVVSGSDILLMPSRYEPCGLTQLIAMRFGTLPIVRRTGGLADTVIDGETGFTFGPPTASALHDAILRYLGSEQRWNNMRRQAMKADYSWTSSARRYIQLYEEVHAGE